VRLLARGRYWLPDGRILDPGGVVQWVIGKKLK